MTARRFRHFACHRLGGEYVGALCGHVHTGVAA